MASIAYELFRRAFVTKIDISRRISARIMHADEWAHSWRPSMANVREDRLTAVVIVPHSTIIIFVPAFMELVLICIYRLWGMRGEETTSLSVK